MKINGIEARETLFEKTFREENAKRWKGKTFIERGGITNGNLRMDVKDGAGKTEFKYVFAGNINTIPSIEYSPHREFLPRAEWSNGSDTRLIESRLRATKKKLGYIEVEEHRHGGKRRGAGRKNK